MANPSDDEIKEILQGNTIAVVGCSTNPEKDAHKIPEYLKEHGYTIIPVNPFADEIMGERAYKSLLDIPEDEHVDIVAVFRPSKDVPPIMKDAIKIGADTLWMQLGIEHPESAKIGTDAGLKVVQNLCLKIEHARLLLR